jgi:hypothetical protein
MCRTLDLSLSPLLFISCTRTHAHAHARTHTHIHIFTHTHSLSFSFAPPLRPAPQLPGIIASPTSAEEHAQNFEVVLKALKDDERIGEEVPPLEVTALSGEALSSGDLQPLNDLAGGV